MRTRDADRRRLLVARLWYEGNAFCLIPADRAAFARREWARGPDALARSRGIETELAAVADFADTHPNWDLVVSRCASALPAGPIEDTVFEAFRDEVVADAAAAEPDAIYLSLHGAAITARRLEPERELVEALRATCPGVPILASFDMHANHAAALIGALSFSTGYRTYPHVDMRETAARALALLEPIVCGDVRPVGAFRQRDVLLCSTNMRTEAGPMAGLQRAAVESVAPPVLDVSVFGGFPYADTPNIAASVVAWADGDASFADAAADALHARLVALAPQFDVRLPTPAEGIVEALRTPGLVAITEASDNPLSGGIGDTPGLLQALVDAAPAVPTVFAALADPDVVARAAAAGIGAALAVRLGGRRTALYGPPVPLSVTVEAITTGRFTNSGPMEHGRAVDCGATALLRAGALRIIVSEHVAPANDPALFALHGIDLTAVRLLCVKAKNHFRAAFAPLCARIIDVETPGPASLDLANLPLRHVRARR